MLLSKVEEEEEEHQQLVTPWEVSARERIDYNKLINQFGRQRLEQSSIDSLQRLTKCPRHVFLRRGIFFAHSDFNAILGAYERGEQFYLYTGCGPFSNSSHLGHLLPFLFTKYLQDAFKIPLVIQLSEDEKCIWKGLSVDQSESYARENAKNIIACGLDVSRVNLRCLIPWAIDQDPYFRIARDIAPRSGYNKPSLIESTFPPDLKE
ncbi:hypothetical protein ACH5RR_007002 [Cinchona calisaya]|uniref:Tryptophanyl-tRNA synthetase n=1 Tax=Cinchona calisaya TaxID=153742 RepID=A0ABD3AQY8_9GENT